MKNETKKISALDYVAARKASSARAEATAASRLIAAAPDLLEALEDAEFLLRKIGINWKEAGSMADSCLRSAVDARAAMEKAMAGTKSA